MWIDIRKLIPRERIQFIVKLVILMITIGSLCRLYGVTNDHLYAKHDIFFESHNLATIKSIQANAPIYSESFYNDLPFIITIYNPLFHYLVAALPQDPNNHFFTGRIVSFVATLLAALLLFLPYRFRQDLMVPILSIGWCFLIREFVRNAAYLRSDNLALLFSALAIVCIDKAKWNIFFSLFVAAFLGFLSFATKQSFLSATITCFVFLYMNNQRQALLFFIISLILYGSFALFAQVIWGNGYWFIVYASLAHSPMSIALALRQWGEMIKQPLFVILVVSTVSGITYLLVRERFHAFRKSPYPYYVIVTFLVLLPSLTKTGSDTNYFMEFILACLLWNVFFIRRYCLNFFKKFPTLVLIIVFFILAVFELTYTKSNQYSFTDSKTTAYLNEVYELAQQEIDELKPPNDRFLHLNTQATLYTFQSNGYFNDPYNYWLMWNEGILEIAAFLDAIERRYFSIILLVAPDNPYQICSMTYFPKGLQTNQAFGVIQKNYTLKKKGVFLYFVPRENES